MKALYAEPFAGISGNMLLGALIDAGVPFPIWKRSLPSFPWGNIRWCIAP